MKWLLGILLGLALSGCYPSFEQPLTPINAHSYDPCLTGAWLIDPIDNEDENDLILHFGPEDEGGFSLLNTEFTKSGLMNTETFKGHVSAIKAGDFLNIQEASDQKTIYFIFGFQLSKNQLILRSLSPDTIRKALKDGNLQSAEKDAPISSSRQEVIKFFEQAGADLFSDDMSFSRITKEMC